MYRLSRWSPRYSRRRPRTKLLWSCFSAGLLLAIMQLSRRFLLEPDTLYPQLLTWADDNRMRSDFDKNRQRLARRWLLDNQTLPSPARPAGVTCGCRNQFAPPACCERTFRRAHKMGYVLTERLFRTRRLGRSISVTQAFRRAPATVDFRDVVLVRNWYDAIVSGYLYHRTGRECWLNHNGRPYKKGKIYNDNFQTFAGGDMAYIRYELDPPARPGDTLCHYLANNTAEVGMRAYMSWILNNGYEGVIRSYVLNLFDPDNRTLFVCYEDLSRPERDLTVLDQCLDWWFPTGHGPWDGRRPGLATNYSGGHATDHDENLRAQLKYLIRVLDGKYFEGVVAWANAIFNCS